MSTRVGLYPGGMTGTGLGLLRFSVAVSVLMLTTSLARGAYIPDFLGVFVAVGLCAGLKTRFLAALSILAWIPAPFVIGVPLSSVAVHAIAGAALMMTGPGAYSADARLFGRRTLTLPKRRDSIE